MKATGNYSAGTLEAIIKKAEDFILNFKDASLDEVVVSKVDVSPLTQLQYGQNFTLTISGDPNTSTELIHKLDLDFHNHVSTSDFFHICCFSNWRSPDQNSKC